MVKVKDNCQESGQNEDFFGVDKILLTPPKSSGLTGKERKLQAHLVKEASGSQFIDKQFFDALKTEENDTNSESDIENGSSEGQESSIFEEQYFGGIDLSVRSGIEEPANAYSEATDLNYSEKLGRYVGSSEYTELGDEDEGVDEVQLEQKHIHLLKELSKDKKLSHKKRPPRPIDIAEKFEKDRKEFLEKEIEARDADGSLKALAKLRDQIEPVWKMSESELVDLMLQQIVYCQDGLVAFNKPYGMSVTKGPSDQAKLLPLVEKLHSKVDANSEGLYLVHAPEKNATGCALFATNETLKAELNSMFDDGRAEKTFVSINRSIPVQSEAKISIPLTVIQSQGPRKGTDGPIMVVNSSPLNDRRARRNRELRNACLVSTDYKVISSASMMSFIESRTTKSITNQVRAHFGLIECPILGDSKYTHFSFDRPQRLPAHALHRLGMRASKTRNLPMFLHLQQIVLPEVAKGQTVVIRAPVPRYFKYTLNKLRLLVK